MTALYHQLNNYILIIFISSTNNKSTNNKSNIHCYNLQSLHHTISDVALYNTTTGKYTCV